MTHSVDPELSILVPVHNEAASLPALHTDLLKVLHESASDSYEIIYCDDGSTDNSPELVRMWNAQDKHVKLITFSRNFGKEYALSALIAVARGRALITLDADGQHPVELIPEFIKAWREGAQVVIGVRSSNQNEGMFKRVGSKLFYRLFNTSSAQKLEPGSTDFRLISREVQRAFLQLPETDRITRGLIDWLGFKRVYIHFDAKARYAGTANYSKRQLLRLAVNSLVSMSPRPLYMFGYVGVFITFVSGILGLAVLIEQIILNDPLVWNFTGTAMLGVLILFLVGVVLMSQGMLSLYVSSMHHQSKQRPLYLIDYEHSVGFTPETSRDDS